MRKWSILVNIVKLCDNTPTDMPLQISSPKKLTKSDRPTNSPLNSPWISSPADTPPKKAYKAGQVQGTISDFYSTLMNIDLSCLSMQMKYCNVSNIQTVMQEGHEYAGFQYQPTRTQDTVKTEFVQQNNQKCLDKPLDCYLFPRIKYMPFSGLGQIMPRKCQKIFMLDTV